MKVNVVHVEDVARAILFCLKRGQAGDIYNLVDDSDADIGSIDAILTNIFGTKIEYAGTFKSKVASLALDSLLSGLNYKHLQAWLKLCERTGISTETPLSVVV